MIGLIEYQDLMVMDRHPNLEKLLSWTHQGAHSIRITGMEGAAKAYFLSRFLGRFDRPCLVVLPTRKAADKFHRELDFFLSEPGGRKGWENIRLRQFPPYDLSPLTGLSPQRQVITRRIESLYALISEKNPIVTTSLDALFFRILPKQALVQALEYLQVSEEVDRDILIRGLEERGYRRTALVEEVGDYAVRGGVLDLFPPLHPLPVRCEFWGDRLESLGHFDPVGQRTRDRLEEVVILPANEILKTEPNLKKARSMGRIPGLAEQGAGFPGQEAWLNHFYDHLDTLLDYLPAGGLAVLMEPERLNPAHEHIHERFDQEVERYRRESAERGIPFPEVAGLLASPEEVVRKLSGFQQIGWSELSLASETPAHTLHFEGRFRLEDDLEIRSAGRGRVSLAPLAEKLSSWLESRSKVILVTRTEPQAQRLQEILQNYEVQVEQVAPSWNQVSEGPGLSICLGRLSRGFVWPELGLYVISEDEIFGPKASRPASRVRSGEPGLDGSSFSQLEVGDLVVHEQHGIGRYGGLFKMEINEKVNDFVLVEYAQEDRLYIPADRISVLQKYVGVDGAKPKLDRLGGRSWDIAKRRARKAVRTIAKQLVEIYALRKYRKGYAFSPPDQYFREFEATFEHEETEDQSRAIEDVLRDMTSENPMDRLICGDVGFGKTEVAVRAAFKAVSDGKQVALLVPTTVLAEQHYQTFHNRMSPYGVRLGILSRFKTQSQQAELLGELRSGKIDVVIGTHRLLQRDVAFHNLGLLIIDEEQRFGVKQKESFKKYRSLVDVLALTATPIPRTLHMSLMGIRDLSIIETPPEERFSIQSYLSPYDESLVSRALRFELHRGGQVFFVHNRVQDIDLVTDNLKRLVPEARFAVAHGQMKERELEKTMIDFIRKDIDVLVCTTIIESGLDIPSANTIVVNEVDRLGLSQVYQLRGRVGRAKERAYAYLLVSGDSALSREAEKRLKALMDFSHLGAGLHLAMHDLRIRGGGNILGFTQSGQITAIGYELYLKLMERAISELKGEEWQEEINPEINVDLPAFLPAEYVGDTDVRLNLYRRLSGIRDRAELATLSEEIQDRFGAMPPEVKNLMALMSVRLRLQRAGISRLDAGQYSMVVTFSDQRQIDTVRLLRRIQENPNKFRFLAEYKVEVRLGRLSFPMDLERIETAIDRLASGGDAAS